MSSDAFKSFARIEGSFPRGRLVRVKRKKRGGLPPALLMNFRGDSRAQTLLASGISKPLLFGSFSNALASAANSPVWRSVLGSKVSHGPTV